LDIKSKASVRSSYWFWSKIHFPCNFYVEVRFRIWAKFKLVFVFCECVASAYRFKFLDFSYRLFLSVFIIFTLFLLIFTLFLLIFTLFLLIFIIFYYFYYFYHNIKKTLFNWRGQFSESVAFYDILALQEILSFYRVL
jgi:hypothetical protein